jgi:hypothetical protein
MRFAPEKEILFILPDKVLRDNLLRSVDKRGFSVAL